MFNSPPLVSTVSTDTWVKADWQDFLTFADDPKLESGRFYYDQGCMRLEMPPLGPAHGQDNTIVATVINLYATVKTIPVKGLINTTFRKIWVQEAQPDLAFFIGENVTFPPHNNAPVNLNEIDPPALVIEIAASSLEDDKDRKLKLYQRMGVREYWVVDVSKGEVIAVALSATAADVIAASRVLPGLEIAIVEAALKRSKTEDDGAISRWLLATFNQSPSC
jgi:Uma2 family endonuclease